MRGESVETMIHIADLNRVSEQLLQAAVTRLFYWGSFAQNAKCRTVYSSKPYWVDFVKRYAKANGLSVTEVIYRYLRRLRLLDSEAPPAPLDEITGLLPADMDAEA